MAEREKYTFVGHESVGPGEFAYTIVPNPRTAEQGRNGMPLQAPRYTVTARVSSGHLTFDWSASPLSPGSATTELESEIASLIRERELWLARIDALVVQVSSWANYLGWATRRVQKLLEDDRLGPHEVPALVMQADTCRILLEPVGSSALGADGVVDLYRMPGYDDIARLYSSDGQWWLQTASPEAPESSAVPLTKETLGAALAELRQHA